MIINTDKKNHQYSWTPHIIRFDDAIIDASDKYLNKLRM